MARTTSTETPPSATTTSKTNGADGNAPQRRNPLPLIAKVGIVAAVVLAGYLIGGFVAPPKIPRSMVALSGRIEGDDSAVAPKTTGRILEIRFREGDSVKAGETIAVLDDEQVLARADQARAAVTVAEARLRSSRDQVEVLQAQLHRTTCRRSNRNWMRAAGCGRRRRTLPLRRRTWRTRKLPSKSPTLTEPLITSYASRTRYRNARPGRPMPRRSSRRRQWLRLSVGWSRRGVC